MHRNARTWARPAAAMAPWAWAAAERRPSWPRRRTRGAHRRRPRNSGRWSERLSGWCSRRRRVTKSIDRRWWRRHTSRSSPGSGLALPTNEQRNCSLAYPTIFRLHRNVRLPRQTAISKNVAFARTSWPPAASLQIHGVNDADSRAGYRNQPCVRSPAGSVLGV
jgi:hypothetical protein